ncbi:MAG TPA: glycosyltransferase [Vicinamibacteria bacterium]|nr:glycosyltransferase [Vicinamibacteria bacterium]
MGESAAPGADPILDEVRRFYESHHEGIERSRRRHRYYYDTLTRILRVRVPEGQRILDLGCGAGHLLAALRPSQGTGIDVSAPAIREARGRYSASGHVFLEGDFSDPALLARAGGPFDVILLVNVVTHLKDVQATLEALHAVAHSRTRVLIYSYSRLWQPLLRLSELAGAKYRQPPEAWLPPEEIAHMLYLADFEVVRADRHIVCPVRVPLLADLANFVGHLPILDWLSLMFGIIARPSPSRRRPDERKPPSVSVVIPCRNEAGHIRPLVERLPDLGPGSEFLFVEGHSTDDTEDTIRKVVAENPGLPLRLLKQTGRGKGDAVREGFAEARGDVLVILDSDMGVAPEDVPKFVDALARGKAEMVNGSRMVYPMEERAMRFLNLLANKFFARLFSWLLGQEVRDTLCGTKVLFRRDYERIAAHRSFFGDFDPFGDFDLLFGAARMNLRIVDLAVRYHERQYGETNISRFRHGWLLLRMSVFAARKLKFI